MLTETTVKQINTDKSTLSPADLVSNETSQHSNAETIENKSTMTKIKDKVTSLTNKKTLKTTLEEIKEKWNEIINKISTENHSLGFVLKMSEAQKVEDGILHITVPYSFHKDKLEESKTIKIMDENFQNFFSERIGYCCKVEPVTVVDNEPTSTPDPELKELAADFGGEVVSWFYQ